MERRKYPRLSIELPLEYWETDDACHGGLVENVSEMGLLIHSIRGMPVGTQLNVRVFFNNGFEFDCLQVRGRIVWKGHCCEGEWEGYRYGVEFICIADEDRDKLVGYLNCLAPLKPADVSVRGDI